MRSLRRLAGELARRAQHVRRVVEAGPADREHADAIAQMLTYGLLCARWLSRDESAEPFTAASARAYLPAPFHAALDLGADPELGRALDDIARLLDGTDLGSVFGATDPLIHFFERFLAAYDPEVRRRRGVYYTADPIVSWIVEAVDGALRDNGYPLGLADHERHPSGPLAGRFRVEILDPAAGTGTFLRHVVRLVHRRMQDHWREGGVPADEVPVRWARYVSESLLPRLHGFEIMMAPHAICHLGLSLSLRETGIVLSPDDRIDVHLANALTSQGAFSVVLGNPPYAMSGANDLPDIAAYKETVRLEEKQITALSNDYVKFMRLAQLQVERAPLGVVGMITGSGWVSGPLFRDMRRSLAATFESIRVLDLGGSVRHGKTAADENVFDIQQGVAIGIFVHGAPRLTAYRRVLGRREEKLAFLEKGPDAAWAGAQVSARPGHEIVPPAPHDDLWARSRSLPSIFGTGEPALDQNLRWGAGFATRHDDFAVAFTAREAVERVAAFAAHRGSIEDFKRARGIRLCTTAHWDPLVSRERLRGEDLDKHVRRVLYRPFDYRYVVYLRDVVLEPRLEFMDWLFHDNLALVSHRIVNGEEPRHDFVASAPVEKIFLSSKTSSNAFVFPMLRPEARGGWAANLDPGFVALWSGDDATGSLGSAAARRVLGGVYAVLSAPSYRARFAPRLAADFARIPIPRSRGLRDRLESLGGELIRWHAEELRSPATEHNGARLHGDGDGVIAAGMPRYVREQRRVHVNATQFFDDVPEPVWSFHVGGHQVCRKWLVARRGRRVITADLAHFHAMVTALSETLRLMAEIDAAIAEYGGWPDAFHGGVDSASSPGP